MRSGNIVAVVAAISTLFISTAHAQFAPPSLAQPPNQNACPPDARVGAPRSNETTGSRTLSDQLAETKGVICPPVGVDPGITAAPPTGGSLMPVIPPPGNPGGDRNLQPR
jgi:hypothetical protein